MDWSNLYKWEISFDINELTHVNSADHDQPASEERWPKCGLWKKTHKFMQYRYYIPYYIPFIQFSNLRYTLGLKKKLFVVKKQVE